MSLPENLFMHIFNLHEWVTKYSSSVFHFFHVFRSFCIILHDSISSYSTGESEETNMKTDKKKPQPKKPASAPMPEKPKSAKPKVIPKPKPKAKA